MPNVIAQVLSPFIAPALAWAGVAMVSVPVAIHLLSRWRRKPQPWGAMRFLLEAYRKQKQRMRFEQWLLLLLRCLIVLMLGLALARPLMVGALGAALGGLDNRGRVVNLLIDDAMSLRAVDAGLGLSGETGSDSRFDRLRDMAGRVLDALDPGDRVTLWRTGRPARAVIGEPTREHARVREALERLEPGYGRPDLANALQQLHESAQARQEADTPTVTFLLSDFARSSQYIDEAVEGATGSHAHQWVVVRPCPPQSNVQLTQVRPQRNVVWLGGASGQTVAAEVTITRYAEDLSESTLVLTFDLLDAEGRSVASVKRGVSFTGGQTKMTLGVDLPVPTGTSRLGGEGGALLTLRARLDNDASDLAADNVSYGAVEVRQRMRVAVVDEPIDTTLSPDALPSPGRWVSLALNPSLVGGLGPIETVMLSPTRLNDVEALRPLDAVMLMRPDRVIRPEWRVLAEYVRHGGVLWVFAPPGDGASPWVTLMGESFEPGWRIGLEAEDAGDGAWSLAGGALTAEPLERLAADWQALIQPVRVYRMLPVQAEPSDAWIRLSRAGSARPESDTTDASGDVLLAHRRVGRGSLLLFSTAVDTRWTNLPTKPLFVPLIHETLHGVLGAPERPGVESTFAGDRPTLDEAWAGVSVLSRLEDDLAGNTQVELQPLEQGVAPAESLDVPGVFQASTDNGPWRLIVNPDSRAGDLRQIDEEALAGWLDGLGNWRWLDEDDPGAVLSASADTADIGWAMLWVVLALVLIETVLSRYFSHAGAGGGTSLTGQVWRTAVRIRSGVRSERRDGRAA